MPWIKIRQRDGLLTHPPLSPLYSSSPPSSSSSSSLPSTTYQKSSSGSKISPTLLYIIVILAVIFFISGLLHLIVRFLIKKRPSSSSISQSNRYPEMSVSDAFQRQLQQLFHLHDSGLDQAYIDALPVFLYKEIVGLKEPFDCAVCLCEFGEQDKLRLLPLCSHAFHIKCIDTWLLSNSTCPLCRGTLFTSEFSIENPVFDFDYSREEDGFSGNYGVPCSQKPVDDEIVSEKRVFPVKLGKFRSTNVGGGLVVERVEGETSSSSSSNLDARRCFSMGSFQYVVADSNLQVALCPNKASVDGDGDCDGDGDGQNGNSVIDGDAEGKKINMRNKGESFSVSKIWQWSKKGKYPNSSDTHMVNSVNVSLPWTERTQTTT